MNWIGGHNYRSMVVQRGKLLEFDMRVASGHMDRAYRFATTERHLKVLFVDPERYLFVFAARHQPVRLAEPELTPTEISSYLATILFAPRRGRS